jgi:hypothetical protein
MTTWEDKRNKKRRGKRSQGETRDTATGRIKMESKEINEINYPGQIGPSQQMCETDGEAKEKPSVGRGGRWRHKTQVMENLKKGQALWDGQGRGKGGGAFS